MTSQTDMRQVSLERDPNRHFRNKFDRKVTNGRVAKKVVTPLGFSIDIFLPSFSKGLTVKTSNSKVVPKYELNY